MKRAQVMPKGSGILMSVLLMGAVQLMGGVQDLVA